MKYTIEDINTTFIFLTLLLTFGISSQTLASTCSKTQDPTRTRSVEGDRFMVAAANPLASEAGCIVLGEGGTAIDAAIAVQSVLSVVEPEASGLAGGSIITYFDKKTKRLRFFEGLSRAPEKVTHGLRTPTEEDIINCGVDAFTSHADVTGRAFGVPGTLKVLDLVHQIYGKKNWNDLFESSISLAQDGFPMPLYMNTVLGESQASLKRCLYPDLRARYCNGDIPKSVDSIILNPELAQVLKEVRDGGANAFYDPQGTIAPAIIDRVTQGQCKSRHDASGPAVIPSLMTANDFAMYKARERDPLCQSIFGHTICSSAPPAFGGVAVLYMLKLMERGNIDKMSPVSADYVHLAIESSRLTQWDRRQYIGDPDYNYIPVNGLLEDRYLKSRFSLISPFSSVNPIIFGDPLGGVNISHSTSGHHKYSQGNHFSYVSKPNDHDHDEDMTSHISIVDSYGNALSMTTTNNSTFGSQMEARGIILNNVQTNFTRLDSSAPGNPVNIMESKKKARTSTAPTIVFDRKGNLKLVVGAAGGGPIPDYVAQTILGVIVHKMDPQTAINQGHFSGQGFTSACDGVPGARSEVEEGKPIANVLNQLITRGHPCPRARALRSGLTAIEVRSKGRKRGRRKARLFGAADPRRDGVAMGF